MFKKQFPIIYHNVIRILMPFVITDDQLEEGFAILEDRLREIARI